MNKALRRMKEFFENEQEDAYEFSIELEDMLCFEHAELHAEDPEADDILQDECPEICADVEPCDPREPFLSRLKKEYERALRASKNPGSPA